jgi:hypothetical protein
VLGQEPERVGRSACLVLGQESIQQLGGFQVQPFIE